MSLLPVHRRHSLFPDLTDWLAGFPAVENIRPFVEGRLIRVEDEMAERSERQETKGRTEFSYGSFVRSVALPAGANEDDVAATYDKGILTIAVPVAAATSPQEKHVAIKSAE